MKRVKTEYDDEWGHETREQVPSDLGEKHIWDTYLASATVPSVSAGWGSTTRIDPTTTVSLGGGAVATPLNLCSPTVGLHIDQRTGRAIRICKVTVRVRVNMAPDDTSPGQNGITVRVLLVLDQQTSGAQFSATDIFASDFSTVSYAQFISPNGFGRYKILCDKFVEMNVKTYSFSGTARTLGLQKYLELQYEWPEGLPVRFNSTAGGTVTSVIGNSLHIMCSMDRATVAAMTIGYLARVEFYDCE